MNYWLVKTEPNTFSIDDMEKNRIEAWDGVRNYQARNFMRDQMRIGDMVLFYHSNSKPSGVVGVCKVTSEAKPDHTAFDPESMYFDPKSSPENPRWILVELKFVKRLPRLVSLAEMREVPELATMNLLRKGNRLSIMPINKEEFSIILS